MNNPLVDYTMDRIIREKGYELSRLADRLCRLPLFKDNTEAMAAIMNEYNAIIDEIQEPWAARAAKRQGRSIS